VSSEAAAEADTSHTDAAAASSAQPDIQEEQRVFFKRATVVYTAAEPPNEQVVIIWFVDLNTLSVYKNTHDCSLIIKHVDNLVH